MKRRCKITNLISRILRCRQRRRRLQLGQDVFRVRACVPAARPLQYSALPPSATTAVLQLPLSSSARMHACRGPPPGSVGSLVSGIRFPSLPCDTPEQFRWCLLADASKSRTPVRCRTVKSKRPKRTILGTFLKLVIARCYEHW